MESYNFNFNLKGTEKRGRTVNAEPVARIDITKYSAVINLNLAASKLVEDWWGVDIGYDANKNVVALKEGVQRKLSKQSDGFAVSAHMLKDIVKKQVKVKCYKENDMLIIDLNGGLEC